MALILHIVSEEGWKQADEYYRHPSLESDGYIHCSKPTQVVAVANANAEVLAEASPLLLLCIDSERVESEIKYEGLHEEEYPHIYGPLNVDSVLDVVEFPQDECGEFQLPANLPEYESESL